MAGGKGETYTKAAEPLEEWVGCDATTGSPRRVEASADGETLNSWRGRTALVASGGIYVYGQTRRKSDGSPGGGISGFQTRPLPHNAARNNVE